MWWVFCEHFDDVVLLCSLQVLFSSYCPLFDTGLTLGMRLLYTSVTWCYITNTFAVPCSVLVPFIALVFGIYPLVLNRDFALASTLYFISSSLVTNVSPEDKITYLLQKNPI